MTTPQDAPDRASGSTAFVPKRRGHSHPWLALLAVSYGLEVAFVVAGCIAFAAALIALLVRKDAATERDGLPL